MVERLKQIVPLAFAFLFLPSTCLHIGIPASAQLANNPYELVVATMGEPETVDPAWAYDIKSQELIFNVYETLLFYDRESVEEFVPMLATGWWISDDGLTYTFKIREGVKFHNGETLSTEDVEYSFERVMVLDCMWGPAWLLYEPLLDVWEANLTDPTFDQKIDNTIQRNATHVWLNLATPYAPFLQVLCQSCSSIVNKQFCVEHGDWPGTFDNWQDYHIPPYSHPGDVYSPLDAPEPVMCGTGPYMFDYWEHGLEWSAVKFDDYWGGWPAEGRRGWVERLTKKFIEEWDKRKVLFLAGDLDIIGVPGTHIGDVWGEPGIRCVYPLPALSCTGFFFNCNVSVPYYLKPPYTSYECTLGELNEGGVPPDFFSDVHVRKGFAYCMDYTESLTIAYLGEAVYPATPAIQGLPYRRADEWYAVNQYVLDLAKAEEEFRLAWGGELWETGFTLPLIYDIDSLPRRTIAEMLEANVESLNPKFHIYPLQVDCTLQQYFYLIWTGELTTFVTGYLADTSDPYEFFHLFFHSDEYMARLQHFSDASVDELIEEGRSEIGPERRREIYYELQELYIDLCPSVCVYQPTGRHWERTWVQGWYYNPLYSGVYCYDLWKEDLPLEDMNDDGTVNILDIARCAMAFGSCYKVGDVHPRWDAKSDLNQDTNVNILDIAAIASKFGSQTLPWQPP